MKRKNVTREALCRAALRSAKASAELERRGVPAGYVRAEKVERFFGCVPSVCLRRWPEAVARHRLIPKKPARSPPGRGALLGRSEMRMPDCRGDSSSDPHRFRRAEFAWM
jgi:hypothetical protein